MALGTLCPRLQTMHTPPIATNGGGPRARTRLNMTLGIAIATGTESVNGIVTVIGIPVETAVGSTQGFLSLTTRVPRTVTRRILTVGGYPRPTPMDGLPPQRTRTRTNPTPRHPHTRIHLRLNREPQGVPRGTPPNLLAIHEQRPSRPIYHNHLLIVLLFLDTFLRRLRRRNSCHPPRLLTSLSS